MQKRVVKTEQEAETIELGKNIAMALRKGDLVFLSGDLGTGKSVLARAIIRQLAGDTELDVPSPTYTLCQTYETILPVAHFDLYRISSSMDELEELGWQEALDLGCAIIEWPERCFSHLPPEAIQLKLEIDDNDARHIEFTGNEELLDRIERSEKIAEFLCQNLSSPYSRRQLTGDASARSYELLETEEENLLLMNAPALPDGPPIKNGKPYSQIVHLAEDVSAFVAIDMVLRNQGFCAPEILARDLDEGLLLTEHFGDDGIVDNVGNPILERYFVAMELLAKMHQTQFPREIQLEEGPVYKIPRYDEEAIETEAELLLQWYVPHLSSSDIAQQRKDEFYSIWSELHQKLKTSEQTLVLRDYHSPNIIWRGSKIGSDRIGIIDFQDALFGPTAYDVASLAQDARVNITSENEKALLKYYLDLRSGEDADFDQERFMSDYAIMAAQRATKILGIFVRLNERDGKPAYLKHLPRIEDYLRRSLKHPDLVKYKDWLESVINL